MYAVVFLSKLIYTATFYIHATMLHSYIHVILDMVTFWPVQEKNGAVEKDCPKFGTSEATTSS